jgi:hypothetical protein
MAQPEWFISLGHEKKMCKLKRRLYVLKQASGAWNLKFQNYIN